MQQSQQALFQRKPSQLEETLQNFIKATQSIFDQVNKNHEIMSRNHDASVKILETRIDQLSRKIAALPSSSGGFTSNTVDNPKNETCKVVEMYFGVVTKKGEAERVQEDEIEKKEGGIKKEDIENQGDKEER